MLISLFLTFISIAYGSSRSSSIQLLDQSDFDKKQADVRNVVSVLGEEELIDRKLVNEHRLKIDIDGTDVLTPIVKKELESTFINQKEKVEYLHKDIDRAVFDWYYINI